VRGWVCKRVSVQAMGGAGGRISIQTLRQHSRGVHVNRAFVGGRRFVGCCLVVADQVVVGGLVVPNVDVLLCCTVPALSRPC
jgi:hypothetical protein